MITLRDMRESDIEDYVRWFTRDTGWMDFDAPWEEKGGTTEEEERKGCRSTMIRMVIGFGVLTVTIVVVWLCLL